MYWLENLYAFGHYILFLRSNSLFRSLWVREHYIYDRIVGRDLNGSLRLLHNVMSS